MKDLKEKLIFLILGGGFLLTALEVRFMHRNELAEHPLAWTPIVYSVLAAVGCFIALGIRKKPSIPLAIVFALGLPVAGAGMYLHLEDHPDALSRMVAANPSRGGGPPALAPLSIGGLAMISLVLVGISDKRGS